MIKFLSNLDWNTQEKKELPKVARDLLVRLFANEAPEKNEPDYDQETNEADRKDKRRRIE